MQHHISVLKSCLWIIRKRRFDNFRVEEIYSRDLIYPIDLYRCDGPESGVVKKKLVAKSVRKRAITRTKPPLLRAKRRNYDTARQNTYRARAASLLRDSGRVLK